MPSPQGRIWNASVSLWQSEAVNTCHKKIERSIVCPRLWSLPWSARINHGALCMTPKAACVCLPAAMFCSTDHHGSSANQTRGTCLGGVSINNPLIEGHCSRNAKSSQAAVRGRCGHKNGAHSSRAGGPVSSIWDNRPHVSDWPHRASSLLSRWVFIRIRAVRQCDFPSAWLRTFHLSQLKIQRALLHSSYMDSFQCQRWTVMLLAFTRHSRVHFPLPGGNGPHGLAPDTHPW